MRLQTCLKTESLEEVGLLLLFFTPALWRLNEHQSNLFFSSLWDACDRKAYKQLLIAPYSKKRDAHLWISLSYPPDTSESFLREFRELTTEFEKDAD